LTKFIISIYSAHNGRPRQSCCTCASAQEFFLPGQGLMGGQAQGDKSMFRLTVPSEAKKTGKCVHSRIYNFPNVDGGWCLLSDVAEMANCTMVEVLERWGPLCKNSHTMELLTQSRSGSPMQFGAHWMSIVTSGGRSYFAHPTSERPQRIKIRLSELYVPAGWATDVADALEKGAVCANVALVLGELKRSFRDEHNVLIMD